MSAGEWWRVMLRNRQLELNTSEDNISQILSPHTACHDSLTSSHS